MKPVDIKQDLAGNSYPGRGIVIGQSADGKQAVVAYFIMGRSVNSRNRVFAEEPDGIRTEAADPAKMEDPSLIIYHPVRQMGRGLIITNGDQTDTIQDFLEKASPSASMGIQPDGPNWTPASRAAPRAAYKLSILKAERGRSLRQTFSTGPAGGHFIHTYKCDGNPIPSYEGEPTPVSIEGDIDQPSPPACGRT